MKELFTRLFGRWLVDPEVLNAYRTKIPNSINVRFDESDGKIVISVVSIDGKPVPSKALLVTEANSKEEVIAMVNDLIMGYREVPLAYRPWFEESLELQGSLNSKRATLVKA